MQIWTATSMLAVFVFTAAAAEPMPEREQAMRPEPQRHVHPLRPTAADVGPGYPALGGGYKGCVDEQ